MSMKVYKEVYEQLIKEDIDVLRKHLPDCAEMGHIEHVLRDSVKHYYPEKIHISTVQDCELAANETKKKAVSVLQKILENWVHGGDSDCIVAEFEEKMNE